MKVNSTCLKINIIFFSKIMENKLQMNLINMIKKDNTITDKKERKIPPN